jgi:hypothetical protein
LVEQVVQALQQALAQAPMGLKQALARWFWRLQP